MVKKIVKKLIPKTILRAIKEIIPRPTSEITKHITGKNNNIAIDQGVCLEKITFDIIGSGNTIQIESGCRLNNVTFTIRGNNCKCVIYSNSILLGGKILFYGHNTCFEIGECSFVGEAFNCFVLEDNTRVIIGKNCMLSASIDILTGDLHLIFDKATEERINFAKNVYINDHVWIGAYSKILKGVILQKDSIVGYTAVVSKPFEESNVIIAGNPARIVKTGIQWSREHCPPFNIVTGDFEYER
jgi:acetyltransferase-like isoleucine patch superfamily enzyme